MRNRSRLYGVLIPLGVTVFILVAAGLGAFIWTAVYVNSVASGAQQSHAQASKSAGKRPGQPPSPTSQATLSSLLGKVHAAVWAVDTFDANGRTTAGSAFAVVSNSDQTLLLTSYSVVSAAAYQPAPTIQVHQPGGANKLVTLRTWDPAHDLALLVLNEGNDPVLHGASTPPQPGQQVYVVSGSGGPDGTITTGKLRAVATTSGLVDDAPQDSASRGGPLIDIDGNVLGVDSMAFVPPQPTASMAGTHVAVPIQDACAEVLVCPGNTFPSS